MGNLNLAGFSRGGYFVFFHHQARLTTQAIKMATTAKSHRALSP